NRFFCRSPSPHALHRSRPRLLVLGRSSRRGDSLRSQVRLDRLKKSSGQSELSLVKTTEKAERGLRRQRLGRKPKELGETVSFESDRPHRRFKLDCTAVNLSSRSRPATVWVDMSDRLCAASLRVFEAISNPGGNRYGDRVPRLFPANRLPRNRCGRFRPIDGEALHSLYIANLGGDDFAGWHPYRGRRWNSDRGTSFEGGHRVHGPAETALALGPVETARFVGAQPYRLLANILCKEDGRRINHLRCEKKDSLPPLREAEGL
ncbi:MAG: hypothetical protein RL325_353, partial [Planctomycetota bacterium]